MQEASVSEPEYLPEESQEPPPASLEGEAAPDEDKQ
jgi:hypothetical protein